MTHNEISLQTKKKLAASLPEILKNSPKCKPANPKQKHADIYNTDITNI